MIESHVLIAIRKKTDDLPSKTIKYLVEAGKLNFEITVAKIEKDISKEEGEFRIYRSVNARNVSKCRVDLAKKILDTCVDDQVAEHFKGVITEFKNLWMHKEYKTTSKFLIYPYDNESEDSLKEWLFFNNINYNAYGKHIVTDPFNPKLLKERKDIKCVLHVDGLIPLSDLRM